jgi:hypothetical protein
MVTSIIIATYPARFSNLLRTLKSLEGQSDVIRICLNEYTHIPDELQKYECVIPVKNLTDNGKFLFWNEAENAYYFSCEDDITYPHDYVARTVSLINRYDTIVTYHGRRLKGLNLNYYRGHKFHHCKDFNSIIQPIDVCGTGVTAFNTNYFKPIDLHLHELQKMSDVIFSHEARNHKIILGSKTYNWIKPQEVNGSIYESESRTNQTNQIKLSNEIFTNRYIQRP